MLKYTVPLPPITKKNSMQILINRSTGRPFIAPSKAYKDYETIAGQGSGNRNRQHKEGK